MHSCEAATSAAAAPAASSTVIPAAPLTGPQLLTQLGRLMVRAGSPSRSQRDRLLQAKLRQASGSRCDYDSLVSSQPKPREPIQEQQDLEIQLERHVLALWNEQIPICIEVVLAPDCMACYKALSGYEPEAAFHKGVEPRGLLIERWTIAVAFKKSHETHMFSTSQWLLNAVRSQLHFSQVSAWIARLSTPPQGEAQRELTAERRRKLSHEKCNIKKLESNCDQDNIPTDNPTTKTLNLVYSIKIPGETYKISDFNRTPTLHTFPLTEIDQKRYLKVSLESLPRTDTIPTAKCFCNQLNNQKRRPSKDIPKATQDDITSKLNDLKLNPPIALYNYHPSYNNVVNNYDNKVKNVLDDRMHTPCSESGKHKCNCDDESDNQKSSNKKTEKKLDEKRLKDIAKHKRRVRKERLRDSSSDYSGTSEGDSIKNKETHTSIPILQASRFDRFKAIGCYRNQTYLTLPATRIETKSPFINDSIDLTSIDKRTNTIATQTDDIICFCGSKMYLKCDQCNSKMVRSDAKYDLVPMTENDDVKNKFGAKNVNDEAMKHTCDIISNKTSVNDKFINNNGNLKCDNFVSFNVSTVRKRSDDDEVSNIIKRPKLKRLFPVVDKIEKIVSDRFVVKDKPDFEFIDRESDDFPHPKRDVEMRQLSFSQDNADMFARTEKESELNFYESNRDSNRNRCFKDMGKQSISDNKGTYLNKVPGDYDIKETNINHLKVPYLSPKDQGFNQIEAKVPGVNDMKDLNLKDTDTVFDRPVKTEKRLKHPSVTEEYVFYEKNYYGTIDRNDNIESPKEDNQSGFQFPNYNLEKGDINGEETAKSVADSTDLTDSTDSPVPTASDVDKFRWRLDSAASMVFHSKTGLPLTSSPAPLKRGNNCFDFDDSINGVSGIKSALFNPGQSSESAPVSPRITTPRPNRGTTALNKLKGRPPSGLLGTFEECALKGRLEAASTVAGFTARIGAYGSFCPSQKRLPVTVFFYALGGNNAPYMGHINLGSGGYHVPRSGTIQVSLLNPHGTLVKMFVVVYALDKMPPGANTFLRQRTLYLPAGAPQPSHRDLHKYLRYTIHLRFMTSKSGKLYLHTDIRIIVSRKADIDAATAHSAILSNNQPTNHNAGKIENKMADRGSSKPCRVFGGANEGDFELGYENQNELGYELRSFTYGPDNPKFSPR